MERKDRCSSCVYVHERYASGGINYECRRYPPVPLVVTKKKHRKSTIVTHWPAVRWNDHCGEFDDRFEAAARRNA